VASGRNIANSAAAVAIDRVRKITHEKAQGPYTIGEVIQDFAPLEAVFTARILPCPY